jgi:nicotinate-nucleotide adenylyltransferase
MDIKNLQKQVDKVFIKNFGRTPLKERLKDILDEAIELNRYTDLKNLKEEAGDLLCSLLQFLNESEWDATELINNTLNKIVKRSVQYKTLGRKTKVAILGGAFDPIHMGHIGIAQAVLNWSKAFDEIWLMPCFEHINGKDMAPASTRLELCKIAAECDGRIKVSDYEITKKLKGETYYLVKILLEEDFALNQYDFSMIIGLDNANTFEKWYNYEHLEKMIRFVVVPRGKETIQSNWFLRPPHIFLDPEKPILDISSSSIRNWAHKINSTSTKKSWHYRDIVSRYLNPDVMKKIIDDKLYVQ